MPYIGRSEKFGVRNRFYYTQSSGGATSISGADDAGKTLTFTDGAYVDVFLNGIALVAGTDYNTTTADTIAGLAALSNGDVIEVLVYDVFNVADTVSASSGGTFSGGVTVDGTMTATSFSGDGSSLTGISAGALAVEYLIVAGGGGAGNISNGLNGAGGGGAGAVIHGTTLIKSGTSYTVTVGAGGAASSTGNDSVFGVTIAKGGGEGADTSNYGGDGGSGGGSSTTNSVGLQFGQSGQHGSNGGWARMSSTYQGGSGGGGAVEAGGSRSNQTGANGGDGLRTLITGTATYYGGGGGGGVDTRYGGGINGTGGLGGGGAAIHSATGTAGTANTGGGGGAGNTTGGAGGSGVVILRILTSQYSGTSTGSPTITTDGDYTILKFTSSGSYTG